MFKSQTERKIRDFIHPLIAQGYRERFLDSVLKFSNTSEVHEGSLRIYILLDFVFRLLDYFLVVVIFIFQFGKSGRVTFLETSGRCCDN